VTSVTTTRTKLKPPRAAAAECVMQAKNIDQRIKATLKAIDAKAEIAPDGYPTSVIGSSPPVATGNAELDPVPLTSVERAAQARGHVDTDRDLLTWHLNEASRHLYVVEQIVKRHHTAADVPLCNQGHGRENWVRWGNAHCKQVAAEGTGGMCIDCWQAEDADRVAHGLERREFADRHHSSWQPRRSGRFTAA
jgi:hypothetical protein